MLLRLCSVAAELLKKVATGILRKPINTTAGDADLLLLLEQKPPPLLLPPAYLPPASYEKQPTPPPPPICCCSGFGRQNQATTVAVSLQPVRCITSISDMLFLPPPPARDRACCSAGPVRRPLLEPPAGIAVTIKRIPCRRRRRRHRRCCCEGQNDGRYPHFPLCARWPPPQPPNYC